MDDFRTILHHFSARAVDVAARATIARREANQLDFGIRMTGESPLSCISSPGNTSLPRSADGGHIG